MCSTDKQNTTHTHIPSLHNYKIPIKIPPPKGPNMMPNNLDTERAYKHLIIESPSFRQDYEETVKV